MNPLLDTQQDETLTWRPNLAGHDAVMRGLVGDAAPSLADAWSYNTKAVKDYIADQRAKSAAMGLWNDETGLPTPAGVVNAAQQTGNALLMGTTAPSFRAFHGSPHMFPPTPDNPLGAFDLRKMGTGEGNQVYGHGSYLAGAEDVAKNYRDATTYQHSGVDKRQALSDTIAALNDKYLALSKAGVPDGSPQFVAEVAPYKQAVQDAHQAATGGGHMYEAEVNADPAKMLDWDKPYAEQHPDVQSAVKRLWVNSGGAANVAPFGGGTGQALHRGLEKAFGNQENAALALQNAGVPGVRYLDAGSRAEGQGTHNYVVFNPDIINIIRRYGLPGLIGGGAAAAATGGEPQS